ncbi:hypothetical protein NMY22_g829 [Coprinellus aureogranulatus]|nr:hypothetical protein NMY22_g829 [Coprinellus aureogranulatus]
MNKFVSLDFLEGLESIGHKIVVVGCAKAYCEDWGDEDEGQEDDEDEGEEFVFLELSEVFQYTLDYGEPDDPVAPDIYEAVVNHKKYNKLIKTSLIPSVIGDYLASTPKRPRISVQPMTHNQIPRNGLIGNPDISVQAKENQDTTHVMPFIASLARGLVNKNLQVVGSRLPEPDKNMLHRNKVERCWQVKELLD